jgi:MinD superfamily P-loop ATPase
LLKPVIDRKDPFIGGKKAIINENICTRCGICEKNCHFNAIENFVVDLVKCEGCGFCAKLCPEDAISFDDIITGTYYEGHTPNAPFVWARLNPGEGNSGKLVSMVKKVAGGMLKENGFQWYFVDGPPGIGCPVNASIAGADYALLVTEPTVSGIHDLLRISKLIRRFDLPGGIVINKFDLNINNTKKIENFSQNTPLPVIGKIPYDDMVINSLMQRKRITDFPRSSASIAITEIWKNLVKIVSQQGFL